MELKPIKNEDDYRNALERLEIIFDAPTDTKEGDEAEILCLMIENYENEHYPIETPDPIEAIKIRMEELNMVNFPISATVLVSNYQLMKNNKE